MGDYPALLQRQSICKTETALGRQDLSGIGETISGIEALLPF
jgi:hypothetical protein